jgi:hemolysin activation/secretion protein
MPCFDIKIIQLKGNTLLSRDDIEHIVLPYKGKCLGKNGVNQLMAKLTTAYIDNGYITSRVYIPPQDLKTGILEFIVIEGTLENFSINNNEVEDRRKLWWAMPPQRGSYLSITEIEQGIDQINRVPSANAKMKLWPGQETGSTHIQVLNKTQDELRGNIEWNNEGQANTGKQKIRFGIDADNILGINDIWGFNYIGSKDTNAVTLNNSFPFRDWTFSLSHSYSEYLNILPGNTDLFGQSNTSTLGADYLVYRNGKKKVNWSTNLTVRRSERRLLGVELTPQKLVPIRTALNLSENLSWGFYSLEAGLVHGTKLFGASKDASNIQREEPKAQFNKLDGRFTIVVPTNWFSYQSTLAIQVTDDLLYSSEQIHIGDKSTVRGFDTTAASGEKGFYWRNDFSVNSKSLISSLGLASAAPWLRYGSVFTFLDAGWVEPKLIQRADRAAGTGLGLRVNYKDVSASIIWSKAIESPEKRNSNEAVYASLQLKVF